MEVAIYYRQPYVAFNQVYGVATGQLVLPAWYIRGWLRPVKWVHPCGHLHLLFLTQNNFTDNACCILIHRALPTAAPVALIRRPLAAKRKLAARASKQQDATGKQLVSGTGGLLYHLMLFLYHALQQCCGACKVD